MVTVEEIRHLSVVASAVTWPFCAIATILYFMRLLSYWKLKNKPGRWEDVIITISWVLEITQAAVFQKGLNQAKLVDLSRAPETIPPAAFWAILMNAWSFLSIEIPKIGVALLVTRLFCTGSRWTPVAIWLLCIVVNVMASVGFITTWVMCDPVAGQWDPYKYPNAKCWPRVIQIKFACVAAGFCSLFNLALCAYPASKVWQLQLPLWKKASVIGLTGLGSVAFVFSVIKLYYCTKLVNSPTLLQLIQLGIWNRIENDFVLMVGLLPFAPAFFRAFRLFTSSYSTSNSNGYHNQRNVSATSQNSDSHALQSKQSVTSDNSTSVAAKPV